MKVAILGGGQLARMMAMSGHRLGVETWVVDPKPDAPAAAVAHHVLGALDDPESWRAIADCEVATAELDHAPPEALTWLARRMPVRPGADAFAVAGDRLREKLLFRELGIATTAFAPVGSRGELEHAISQVGVPAVLKTRHEGYDGRGQRMIRAPEEASQAWQELGGEPSLLEGLVPFDREVSILAVRGPDGEVRFWSPVANHHEGGILRHSRPLAPGAEPDLEQAGQQAVAKVLEALDYVGVLAVEFFEVGGELMANEFACRVHNSGHWTEEGAETSQFENHVRAILGLPLGSTGWLGPTAMVNLIGSLPPREALLSLPNARVHLYGKTPAPGRKLGHVTLRASDDEGLDAALARLSRG